ncbi:hypothetical protein Psi01_80970 [Planobispora siamensis]|uniref:Uncharacterized protein n=1 Tax=Planobispora siamensis TaxID=936338 RepID=A0A8J3SRB8_9ACTN|nr:hypothetical protein Psi01_80970 [Planobispora siamensis]
MASAVLDGVDHTLVHRGDEVFGADGLHASGEGVLARLLTHPADVLAGEGAAHQLVCIHDADNAANNTEAERVLCLQPGRTFGLTRTQEVPPMPARLPLARLTAR